MLDLTISAYGDDTDPPEFISLNDNYTNLNQEMNILISISDISEIDSVTGYYDLGNGEQQITLNQASRFMYEFEGTIPAQAQEISGWIRFVISDIYNNVLETEQFEIAWVDGVIPWNLQFSWEYEMDPDVGPPTGIEFDGDFFYSSHYQDCYMRKYSSSGELLADIPVSGAFNIRDLAWDGAYLYGSRANDLIWQIDVSNMTVTNTIASQQGTYRGIAYDDDLDGFWGNNWDGDIVCTGRDGSTNAVVPDPGLMSVYGIAYDNVSEGGPYLWLFDQGNGYGSPQYIRQLNIESWQFTGVQFDVTLRLGNGTAYGLFTTTDYENGIFTIGGLMANGSGYYDNYTIFGLTYSAAVTSSPEGIVLPFESIQLSNHPNPFNPTTKISFSLPVDSSENAELVIYNLKGQKIKTFLINSSADQPINSVVWNSTDDSEKPVSSGMYFYKMNAGKFQETRKMILMK